MRNPLAPAEALSLGDIERKLWVVVHFVESRVPTKELAEILSAPYWRTYRMVHPERTGEFLTVKGLAVKVNLQGWRTHYFLASMGLVPYEPPYESRWSRNYTTLAKR